MRDPLDHVQELAGRIDPRGATTEGERRGAEYARREMERWAHAVTVEPFSSCPTLSRSRGLVAVLLVASAVPVWLWPWGVVRPRGEVRHRVVLAPHLDSTRSALFYHPARLHLFRLNHILNIVTGSGLLLLSLLAALRVPPGVLAWRLLTLPLAAIALYGGCVLLHRELCCDYIPGANDNASGVAVALWVGEAVAADPGNIEPETLQQVAQYSLALVRAIDRRYARASG